MLGRIAASQGPAELFLDICVSKVRKSVQEAKAQADKTLNISAIRAAHFNFTIEFGRSKH